MKRVLILLSIILLGFAGWHIFQLWEAQQQLEIAEERVNKVVQKGSNNLVLNDLTKLRRLPRNINEIKNLKYLYVRGTNLEDISGLEGNPTLAQLDLNFTRVSDLTPLRNLQQLELIYLQGSWVKDVSPLTTLPALEQLDIGRMQIETLQPLTRIRNLLWLNLYKSHALDGSKTHFNNLEERPGLALSGGSAYKQNYQPGWLYNTTLHLSRFQSYMGL